MKSQSYYKGTVKYKPAVFDSKVNTKTLYFLAGTYYTQGIRPATVTTPPFYLNGTHEPEQPFYNGGLYRWPKQSVFA